MPAEHVLTIFAVEALARSARFYEQGFGWTRTVDDPVYVELALPRGMSLGLYERAAFARNTGSSPLAAPDTTTTASELYLLVDDVDTALRRVIASGGRLLSGAAERSWGDIAAYVADPDGNVVVVAQSSRALDDASTLRDIAERWMSLWQDADLRLVEELHAGDFVDHGAAGRRADRMGVRDGILELRQAFPDFHATIEDLIVDELSSKIVVRWTATGTHRGDLPGLQASGRKISFRGIEILQVVDGKIVERWGEWDQSGWLGVVAGDEDDSSG